MKYENNIQTSLEDAVKTLVSGDLWWWFAGRRSAVACACGAMARRVGARERRGCSLRGVTAGRWIRITAALPYGGCVLCRPGSAVRGLLLLCVRRGGGGWGRPVRGCRRGRIGAFYSQVLRL